MTLPISPTPATTKTTSVPTLIIRPPKKWVPVDFRELLRIPRTALQFCLPGREDPVQTNRPWISLGDHPAGLYDGYIYRVLRGFAKQSNLFNVTE